MLYDGRKVRFSTILSRLIVLKGKIDDDYNEFVRIAKLNWYSSDMIYGIDVHDKHYEEVVKQVKEHTKGIEEQVQTGDTEMLSEFVWDFN